jgi:acyl carrier protein
MTEERLRALLHQAGVRDARGIGREVSLYDSGALDSFLLLEVLLALEKELGVRIDNRDITPENLDSIERLQAFVARLQASGP